MNINTKAKLMGAVLCAFGLLLPDFVCANDATQLDYYNGRLPYRSMWRQAECIMEMFGGVTVKAGNIKDEVRRNEAFRLIYDAMRAYFRLYPERFNIGKYGNDTTYLEYAAQCGSEEFNIKINAMERFFNIRTDKDRKSLERLGKRHLPLYGVDALHGNVREEVGRIGNAIVVILGLKNPTNNFVDAIDIAGDMAIADTQAKKDILMFYRCIRSSMSLNSFGYSMITPQGMKFTNFVISTLK